MAHYNYLFVDDEASVIHFFERLSQKDHWEAAFAKEGHEALDLLDHNEVDVALVDLNLPGVDGLEILKHVKEKRLPTEVILMTGKESIQTAVSAMKLGAYDYITKPFAPLDELVGLLEKAQQKSHVQKSFSVGTLDELKEDAFQEIYGRSDQMREIFGLITSIAASQSNTLILGESGTGKELVAKALHRLSARRDKPFVVINCAALPESLLESELFGYQKGSFTGAVADKKGLFEEAHQGTIFLDEIGEISPHVQVKLLRILQNGELRRIGAQEATHVDTRVIAATNQDLQELVRQHRFREDLFYRLNVITINLPPLRERSGDIPLLTRYFLNKFSQEMGKQVEQMDMEVLPYLQGYGWPGNVRELENVIERAVVLCETGTISTQHLPQTLLNSELRGVSGKREEQILSYNTAKENALNLFNQDYISRLLEKVGGNISIAAQHAGMDRSNFKRIIRKTGIDVRLYRK